jgi:YHS domain-containing protein
MANTYQDPVCGMQVAITAMTDKSEYQGHTYYFCSAECKQTFDKNPEKYTQQKQKNPG